VNDLLLGKDDRRRSFASGFDVVSFSLAATALLFSLRQRAVT
jgi:hypothetical protein